MKKDKNILSFSTASKNFDYKIYISWEEAMKDKNVIPCGLVPKKSKTGGGTGKSGNPTVKSILLEFIAKQEKFNDKVEKFIENQEKFNDKVEKFIENQEKFNDEQRKFNEYVVNVFKANNLKY